MTKIVHLLPLIAVITQFASAQRCLNEAGHPVDWYALYKFPRHSAANASESSFVQQGLGYAYVDATNVAQGWVLSKRSIGIRIDLRNHN